MTSTDYLKTRSFVDIMYHFYFFDHKKQFIVYACTFIASLSYIAINVFFIGRNEWRVIVESIFITSAIYIGISFLYCICMMKKMRRTYVEDIMFKSFFYGRSGSRPVKWQRTTKHRPQKAATGVMFFRSDTKMHSNILCE